MQYSDFSVVSGFPYNTVYPLRNFLAVLSPTPANLYKVETREKFWIHAPNICLRGEGRGWVCAVNWETPQKCKSVQSLLLMIVGCGLVIFFFFSNQLRVSYKCKYRSKTTSREYEPSWHLHTYESTFSVPQGIKSRCVFLLLRRNHNLIKPNFHLTR